MTVRKEGLRDHDQAATSFDLESNIPHGTLRTRHVDLPSLFIAEAIRMTPDAISDVLRVVRLKGAVFFSVE